MKKLTKAQIEVLGLLEICPRETTRTTHHGYVSGATAQALLRRGFVKYEGRPPWYGHSVEITIEGKVALFIAKNHRPCLGCGKRFPRKATMCWECVAHDAAADRRCPK